MRRRARRVPGPARRRRGRYAAAAACPGGIRGEAAVCEAPLPAARVAARKHQSTARRVTAARLMGRGRRRSAALRRGSCRQTRVQHNSCASVATTVEPSEHPAALSTAGLLGGRRPKVHSARESPRQTKTSPRQGNGTIGSRGKHLVPSRPAMPAKIVPSTTKRTHGRRFWLPRRPVPARPVTTP